MWTPSFFTIIVLNFKQDLLAAGGGSKILVANSADPDQMPHSRACEFTLFAQASVSQYLE